MGNANSHRLTADDDCDDRAYSEARMEERRAVHATVARYRKQAWQMEQQMQRPAPELMNFDDFAEESAAYLNTH